jgi:hypothetical protein
LLFIQHIDATTLLLLKRAWQHPKAYGTSFTILNIMFHQCLMGAYEQGKWTQPGYSWDGLVMSYVLGNVAEMLRPWNTVDRIYFIVNLRNSHWVLAEVDLVKWMINVYDSDHSCNIEKFIMEEFGKYARILPRLMQDSGLFPTALRKGNGKAQTAELIPFGVSWVAKDIVPQSFGTGTR